jgi:carbonic anhydrase/acetyltransferase-like protein (isoleucine patch superfamily)
MSGIILPYKGITPKIAADAFIAPSASVIGNVEIGSQASLWFSTVVRGDHGDIHIGARSNLQDGTIVHVTLDEFDTWIGEDVLIGHAAIIHGCTLEDGAFIGMRACILDGAVVEGGAMVAADALVTGGKRVKKGELWAGSPAKLFRMLTDKEQATLHVGAEEYRILGQEMLAQERN